ncbi:MAG TPA: PhzF family phenazine biosynthesis protein [Nitrospirae bacterium]|nr:trans-2,3-dihydro-3-hydroxyanthranilate isomerase [bacterium BMS3Bbin09]HDN94974.1 PhzF family phenazine biosynthesis protein [Nitrospirota bacterium]HDO67018.1 PhzF family phenazine biosynthesis protein [Nitrospirota bacterium]HEW81192.1 PhzF family phenazine biosynthesis protein [Nitrospirota bacterium]
MKLKFNIVDVFAEARYSGNQLAVFHNAGQLPDAEMQRIAKEMNYSETTFIVSDKMKDNGYKVRIFTPEREVPFAGHPVIGTAYVILREVVKKPIKKIKLNLEVGQVPVAIKYNGDDPDKIWMKQQEPVFGDTFDIKAVAEVLNLGPDTIDEKFPVQDVSTGLPFIIVPLKTLNDVRAARIDRDKYYSLIKGISAKAIFIFSPETYETENDLNARMFADYYGIPEDPATGSANGCLAAYLSKNKYFGDENVNVRVEQGYEIGRPSLLYLRAEDTDGNIEVHVGGRVVMVAQGEFI